jgi:hypothetical protein
VLSKEGVRFAGQSYGRTTRDGRPRGKRVVETVARSRGGFRIAMPPGSAALVTVRAAR